MQVPLFARCVHGFATREVFSASRACHSEPHVVRLHVSHTIPTLVLMQYTDWAVERMPLMACKPSSCFDVLLSSQGHPSFPFPFVIEGCLTSFFALVHIPTLVLIASHQISRPSPQDHVEAAAFLDAIQAALPPAPAGKRSSVTPPFVLCTCPATHGALPGVIRAVIFNAAAEKDIPVVAVPPHARLIGCRGALIGNALRGLAGVGRLLIAEAGRDKFDEGSVDSSGGRVAQTGADTRDVLWSQVADGETWDILERLVLAVKRREEEG